MKNIKKIDFYVNGRFLSQKITGVQRVAVEVSSRLNNKLILQSPAGKLSIFYEQLVFPFKCKSKPLISFCNVGPIFVRNQFLYIHDVAVFENSNWFSWAFSKYYKLLLPILARRVKKIITVSNFSKREIVKHLKVSPDKVEVIYNGVSSGFDVAINKPIKEKLIITVSSLDPRKNLTSVISAWKKSKLKLEGYRLVVIGGSFSNFQNDDCFTNDSSIQFTGYVSDNELKEFYQKASGFVYMSQYEGFGLPVLEAMLAKIPVLTSNTTSLKEIAIGHSLMCDPLDIDAIAANLDSLPDLESKTLEGAYSFAKSFTWDKAADNLLSIIERSENEET